MPSLLFSMIIVSKAVQNLGEQYRTLLMIFSSVHKFDSHPRQCFFKGSWRVAGPEELDHPFETRSVHSAVAMHSRRPQSSPRAETGSQMLVCGRACVKLYLRS